MISRDSRLRTCVEDRIDSGDSCQMILTIAIPTYNRNEILKGNLAKLLPQLTPDCFLLILDNNSSIPVSETLHELLAQYIEVRSAIVRHKVNIGAIYNVLRCFEMCETPWVWVLGDDDPPNPDAIKNVTESLKCWPEAISINFSSGIHRRSEIVVGRGREEYLEKLDSFSNALFLSTGIYRVEPLLSYFVYGAEYSYGDAPHFVLMLAALQEDKQFVFQTQQIVDWSGTPAEVVTWSVLGFLLRLPANMDLPIRANLRKRLRTILAFSALLMVSDLRTLLLTLLLLVERKKLESETAIYMMDQIYGRLLRYHPNRRTRCRALAMTFMVRFPKFSIYYIRKRYWIKYRKALQVPPYYVDREIVSAKLL